MKLLINLVIIAGLLCAIFFAWQHLEKVKTERAAELVQAEAKQKLAAEAARAEAKQRADERKALTLNQNTLLSLPRPQEDGIVNPPRAGESHNLPRHTTIPKPSIVNPSQPDKVDEKAAGPEFATLKKRAIELVASADRKNKEQLAENAKTLTWNLDNWLRTLPKNEQANWRPEIDTLKKAYSDGRVPSTIATSDEINLSTKMEEFLQSAISKQKEIDAAFLTSTGNIHRAYVAKIQQSITKANEAGQKEQSLALEHAMKSATDFESWLMSLGSNLPIAANDS